MSTPDATPLIEERDKLERLLRGACRSLAKCEDASWGADVLAWWNQQPEAVDEQARSAVLSVSTDEYTALATYVKHHGHLPSRE